MGRCVGVWMGGGMEGCVCGWVGVRMGGCVEGCVCV